MITVEIVVLTSLLAALRKAPHELRLAAAIHWHQQGIISMERAAESAGLARIRFLADVARRRVDVFTVDREDLTREIRGV
jgi:predicted HTH domain antitoxin